MFIHIHIQMYKLLCTNKFIHLDNFCHKSKINACFLSSWLRNYPPSVLINWAMTCVLPSRVCQLPLLTYKVMWTATDFCSCFPSILLLSSSSEAQFMIPILPLSSSNLKEMLFYVFIIALKIEIRCLWRMFGKLWEMNKMFESIGTKKTLTEVHIG